MNQLFVYGTLLHENTQHYVYGRSQPGKKTFVSHWYKKPAYPNSGIFRVVPKNHSQVKGKILQVTDKELMLLDDFESEGVSYRRWIVLTQNNLSVFMYGAMEDPEIVLFDRVFYPDYIERF